VWRFRVSLAAQASAYSFCALKFDGKPTTEKVSAPFAHTHATGLKMGYIHVQRVDTGQQSDEQLLQHNSSLSISDVDRNEAFARPDLVQILTTQSTAAPPIG
jgi:hypothetical protein